MGILHQAVQPCPLRGSWQPFITMHIRELWAWDFFWCSHPGSASTAVCDGPTPSVSNPSPLTANVTIFSPSSFFTVVQTGMGLQLQVQLVPIMQVFVRLDPSYHGQMCGEAPAGLRVGPWLGDWWG